MKRRSATITFTAKELEILRLDMYRTLIRSKLDRTAVIKKLEDALFRISSRRKK